MNIDALLRSLNSYARDYISYLIRFFNHHIQTEEAEHLADEDGRIFVHSAISLVLGIYLAQVFVRGALPNNDAIIIEMARQMGNWLFFAIVIYALARAMAIHTNFDGALSATLRVFPPAFMIGSAATLFVIDAFNGFSHSKYLAESRNCESWIGLISGTVIVWLLTIFTLPFALSQSSLHGGPTIPLKDKWRRRSIVAIVGALFFLTELVGLKPQTMREEIQHYCLAPPPPLTSQPAQPPQHLKA